MFHLNSEKQNQRGYQIIEPPIYSELNWDMDMIVSCLEVLRKKLRNHFPHFPQAVEFDLLAMNNFLGQSYPVIGIYCSNETELKKSPQFSDLYDEVEKLVISLGLENIKKEAIKGKPITWTELKTIGSYPSRYANNG